MGLILKSRLGYKHIEQHDKYLQFHPAIAVHMHPHAFIDADINFGSKPFLFDIEGHFSWHAKNKQLAHNLPIEILLIFCDHLGYYNEYEQDLYKTRMKSLSSVCRTLHGIFQPKLLNPLILLHLLSTLQQASAFKVISEPFEMESIDAYLIAEIAKGLFSVIGNTDDMKCDMHFINESTNIRIIKVEYKDQNKVSGSDNSLPKWHFKFQKSTLGHELVELSITCFSQYDIE